MTKPKPRLRVVRPEFRIAVSVVKARKEDEYVILPRSEFEALIKAAKATNA